MDTQDLVICNIFYSKFQEQLSFLQRLLVKEYAQGDQQSVQITQSLPLIPEDTGSSDVPDEKDFRHGVNKSTSDTIPLTQKKIFTFHIPSSSMLPTINSKSPVGPE